MSVPNTLAELIIGGSLASAGITDNAHEDQGATVDRHASVAT